MAISFHSIAKAILMFLGIMMPLAAESIQLFYDPATPQIAFAAGDIKTALEKRKHTVEVFDLAALEKAGPGKKIILGLVTDKALELKITESGGKPVSDLGAQAYSVQTTVKPTKCYWIMGGDANGAMYGGLQLAEYIQFKDLSESYDEKESPHLKNRGIKFNIPLDKKSPTYFYGFKGTSHKLAVKDVWEL
ncbi:MAG: hypothetical protein ACRDBP_10355, partial [Luteolibacter sp.]